jgi:hypothetical protein
MRIRPILLALMLPVVALLPPSASVQAQIRLPALPALPLQGLPQGLDRTTATALDPLTDARQLEISRLIRANRRTVDTDPNGEPVVREEILALSPDAAALALARSLGFSIARQQSLAAGNIQLIVLRAPAGKSTTRALRALRAADPRGVYDYNHLYTGSGTPATGMPTEAPAATPPEPTAPRKSATPPIRIGLLDTGVDGSHPVFHDSRVRGFGCGGAPVAGAHGTAVASLLVAQAGADLYAADVYCGAAAGAAVDAIAAALEWLDQEQVPVINVSLVGPRNALLERIVGALTARGHLIVAAVGNDGPAAPPLYPAAYAGVVGVTAVDAKRRVLLEAERGPQVMFAARGADLMAANLDHGYSAVRGTSFAAPTIAALLARSLADLDPHAAGTALQALAQSAIDLGPRGRDLTYGFGLVGADTR